MWPRSMRFRGVFIGIVIGSGVVGLLVAWTNEDFYMTTSTPTIGPGKKWLLEIVPSNATIVWICQFRVRL